MKPLAYVFWHWPRYDVPVAAYTRCLVAFHERLLGSACPGLLHVASFSLATVPWANAGAPAYEDWYVLADSAALDAVNAAAVGGACGAAHEVVAGLAAGGVAGLYDLRAGVLAFGDGPVTWLAKPATVAYTDFLASFETNSAVWQRRMTLGPAPEFCAVGDEQAAARLPNGAIRTERRLVFSGRVG